MSRSADPVLVPDPPIGPIGPDPGRDRHLDLLSLLFVVSGLLAGLVALALVALGFGAMALIGGQTADMAAGFAAAVFLVLAIILLAYAGACMAAGRGLRRRQMWARFVGLLLSLINLFIVPFGTALGIYAFWVLLRQRSRELLGVA
jgi:hypothetical protein